MSKSAKCKRCSAKKASVKTYHTTSGRTITLCRDCLDLYYGTEPAPDAPHGFVIEVTA